MNVNEFEIVRMRWDDIPKIAEMERYHFSTPWLREELEKHFLDETVTFFVCLVSGNLVGYISRMHSFETMDILTLCVQPEYRRKGVAAKLLSFLCEEAKNKGVQRILLEVRKSNLAAVSLYEKFGFAFLTVRKRYYTNPVEDALILQKEIGS